MSLPFFWQQEVHGGVWAQQVQPSPALTADTITIAGVSMATNQWAGYTLSLLAKFDPLVEIPILNMPVVSSTASDIDGMFTVTIGPNSASVQLPDLTTLLATGDVVMMRTFATFTDTGYSDANIANSYYPSGMTGVEAGHLAMVLTGADAGDVQTIASVGTDGFGNSTVVNLAGSWEITPATGDIVVVVAPATEPGVQAGPFRVPDKAAFTGIVASPNVLNLSAQSWVVTVRTEDINGKHGPDRLAPSREIYLFGGQGTRTVFESGTMLTRDGTVLFVTTDITMPAADSLAAAITDTTGTTISLTSGADAVSGTVILIDTERMRLLDKDTGEVERGFGGTTAATHLIDAAVTLPGALTFTLLAAADIPNLKALLVKVSEDINYVLYQVAPGSDDTLPGGGTTGLLVDDSASLGTVLIQFPG